MSRSLFISYRRDDSAGFCRALRDRLSGRYDVFLDVEAIRPGEDFRSAARDAIAKCQQ